MATIDPVTGAITYSAFYDSFDAGLVNFPDNWNVDTSVPGQVTLQRPETYLTAGMLEATGSASTGHGYGTYTVNAMLSGGYPGSAVLLWPGDNIWPGSEIDMAEVTNDGSGRQFAALHWDNGGDQYDVRLYDPGIQNNVFHEYRVVWEPGKLTFSVDGVQQSVYTEHVPADYAHGGMDHVFGFLNLKPYTSLTVTDARYVPLSTTAVVVQPPPAAPPPTSQPPTSSTPGGSNVIGAGPDTLVLRYNNFGAGDSAGGWASDDRYPRHLADVNGDGRADIVGFGEAGVLVTLANGTGGFSGMTLGLAAFGAGAGGWASDDRYPRHLADVNGDGRADIVGFGEAGVLVSLANGTGGFGGMTLGLAAFGAGAGAGGWASDDRYPRHLADVNGDGRADIVGFGEAGVLVSLGNGAGGFGGTTLALGAFGAGAGAGGWASDDRYPRHLADVNGDGRADIVGFAEAGVLVSLANGTGGFGGTTLALAAFGAGAGAGGWASDDRYPRHLADVNGDGRADIAGFGNAGVYVALADSSGGFGSMALRYNNFGAGDSAGGWSSDDRFPRHLADVNGDGRTDIVGFGNAGVYVALSGDVWT